jgi:maltodextrin utilization protein YvdJ
MMSVVFTDIIKVFVVAIGMSPLTWLSRKHRVRVVSSLISDFVLIVICQFWPIRLVIAIGAALTAYAVTIAPAAQQEAFRVATDRASKEVRKSLGMED